MSGAANSPMLKAAGLWAKTSAKGGQYLTGRLGGVKVLILENKDRQGDDPTHHLFFVEAAPRQGGQERAGQVATKDPGPHANAYQRSCQAPPPHQAPRNSLPAGDDVPPWER
jgi:hypothetical protein